MPGCANAVWQTAWLAVAADTAMPEQPEIGAPPSVNVTVPRSGAGATAAANDTAVPAGAGLADGTSVVVVELGDGGWAIP